MTSRPIQPPPPFLRRVQFALGMSAMEMAHALAMSIAEYEVLAKSTRAKLSPTDPMWVDIMDMLNRHIGACTGVREEINTFTAARR